MTHKEQALYYFSHGFNCSQAVFTTFAAELGVNEELALQVATNFGGGARCGQLCGAVAGALMVLGLKHGHCHAADIEEKSGAYAIAAEFNRRFTEMNGSVVCRDLLGYDVTSQADTAIIKEKNLFTTICPRMVANAVDILEQMLKES